MPLDGILKAEKFGRSNMIKKLDAEKVTIHGKAGRPKKDNGIRAKEVKE